MAQTLYLCMRRFESLPSIICTQDLRPCRQSSVDKTRQDKTRQDKTRQDKTRQDKTRQDKTYILLNGLTYNPAEYFTSFERILRETQNARNE